MIERRRDIASLAASGIAPEEGVHFPLTREQTQNLVRAALEEDEAFNDITTIATIVNDRRALATLVAGTPGVIAGLPLACEAFRQLDSRVEIRVDAPDSSTVAPQAPILVLSGHAREMLSAERVALNFLQRLSGIATLTARYVNTVRGWKTSILDTRKTTPGWRQLEKYAVRCGGGMNHRLDLAGAILIKDNHLAALEGDVALAIRRAREAALFGGRVEVECESIEQVRAAVEAGADIVMLDNMSLNEIREAVAEVAGRAVVEVSGGVSLDRVREIAEAGVNWISVGALTHSAPALDLSLEFG